MRLIKRAVIQSEGAIIEMGYHFLKKIDITVSNHLKFILRSGPFAWRDTLTPFQLLAKYCTLTGKELRLDTRKPEIINIDETPYTLSDFGTLMSLFLNHLTSVGQKGFPGLP